MSTEREEFHTWAMSRNLNIRAALSDGFEYQSQATELHWFSWQARGSLNAALIAEDKAEIDRLNAEVARLRACVYGSNLVLKHCIGALGDNAGVRMDKNERTLASTSDAWLAEHDVALRESMCAAITAADDAAVDYDYMLDAEQCIMVIRGEWSV